ncbi:MAG: hypothetical protein JXJ04_06365 [Spirochaetales bacterium]|nr:hypothetical protein [Spirochaetales bacterium]
MHNIVIDPKYNYRCSKEQNKIYIDIRLDFYREIYNVWDFSPLINRDLDDDLFEYLENCAGEIPKKYSLSIVFHVPAHIKDPEKEKKSITGFKNYFNYQMRKINQEQRNIMGRSGIYGFFGVILIFIGYFLKTIAVSVPFLNVLIEGFFIGGWVLFWELFSTVFFKQSDVRRRKYIINRLKNTEIIYTDK